MPSEIGIISYAHSKYGVLKEDTEELIKNGVNECLNNVEKGIDPKEVDWIIVSFVDNQFSNLHQAGTLAWECLGNPDAKGFRVEAACSSGSLAVYMARKMILADLAKNVLVIGFEKMSNLSTETVTMVLSRGSPPEERKIGITQPAAYALMAQEYMRKYKATEDDFALFSVKNHKNATKNPWAQFHREVTIEDVKNSRVIAPPIRLLHCSPISDGMAAILISGTPRKYTDTPIYIKGMGMGHDAFSVYKREDPAFLKASKIAADEAYKEADINPKQVDIAEVHDAFVTVEPMCYEALDFANKGEGCKLIREGVTTFDGQLPVNVSGGLKAKGHPIGATGIGMMIEIFLQIRGQARERQVKKNVDIGVVENHGGTGSVSIVTVLSR
jgi:acetyl-CoA C-acetyltransferase